MTGLNWPNTMALPGRLATHSEMAWCWSKFRLISASVVNPDPYWIRSQELCGSGSTHVHCTVKIGLKRGKGCRI